MAAGVFDTTLPRADTRQKARQHVLAGGLEAESYVHAAGPGIRLLLMILGRRKQCIYCFRKGKNALLCNRHVSIPRLAASKSPPCWIEHAVPFSAWCITSLHVGRRDCGRDVG